MTDYATASLAVFDLRILDSSSYDRRRGVLLTVFRPARWASVPPAGSRPAEDIDAAETMVLGSPRGPIAVPFASHAGYRWGRYRQLGTQ